MHLGRRSGGLVFYRDYGQFSAESATTSLGKLSREVRLKIKNTEAEAFVGIDCLPPSDEMDIPRQCRSISALLDAGCFVIAVIAPEARQLLEELTGYVLLTTEELSDRAVFAVAEPDDTASNQLFILTRGIPTLVLPLRNEADAFMRGEVPSAYTSSLATLVELGLRRSLCLEELRLRLVIMLLGKGSFDDLKLVFGSIDVDLLIDLANWSPFYGVDLPGRSFCSVTQASCDWLKFDLPRFNEVMAACEDVCAEVFAYLGKRGDFARLSALLSHCGEGMARAVLVEWGPEILDSGGLLLVSSKLGDAGPGSAPIEELGRAVQVLAGTAEAPLRAGRAGVSEAWPLDRSSQLCRQLEGACGMLGAQRRPEAYLASGSSGLEKRLALHETAFGAVLCGRFGEALETLASHAGLLNETTVTGCLLTLDLALAEAFACGAPWAQSPAAARGAEYLESRGYGGLMGYVWFYEALLEALREGSMSRLEMLGATATRHGNAMVAAFSKLAVSILGIKQKPSAYVLAGIGSAESACSEVGFAYGARVARILKQVERFRLGEHPRLYEVEAEDGLGAVSRIVRDATCDAADDIAPLATDKGEIPANELWLLIVLTEGAGEFSEAFEDQVPPEWRRGLEVARRNCLPAAAEGKRTERERRARAGRPGAGTLRINLLGEYSIWVDGKRVPDWALEGRGAKALVEYLALQKNHLANRVRLAQDLWPGVLDEQKGRQRVYQATTTVRKALAGAGFEEELFTSQKTVGVLSLAPDLVTCDVDEFVACAKTATDSVGDARACEAALRAEALYAGDLSAPAMIEEMEFYTQKRAELKRAYADAMVAGGEAALRLNKRRLAARLAANALMADELREDAAVLMIRALRQSGRGAEAMRRYQVYAKKLAQASGQVPSRQLREALSEPVCLLPDDLAAPRARRLA